MPSSFFKKSQENINPQEDHYLQFLINSIEQSQGISHVNKFSKDNIQDINSLIREINSLLETYKASFNQSDQPSLQNLMQSEKARLAEQSLRAFILNLFKNNILLNLNEINKEKRDDDVYSFKFSQSDYIALLKKEKHPRLYKISIKYTGLCDLICNYMTANQLLDEKISSPKSSKEKLLEDLESQFSKTHIIQKATFIQLILAMVFHIYPNSLLTRKDNKKVFKNKTLDKNLFLKSLEKLSNGEDAKFCAFQKNKFSIFDNGHSMLIKKCDHDKFIFFDPNNGATKPLNKEQLFNHVNDWLKNNPGYNEICLMNNTKYLNKIFKLNHSSKAVRDASRHGPSQNSRV